jgi:hypothetical protein
MVEQANEARSRLVQDAYKGGLTLVLGAGVAGACNVATWRELALRLWREAFGHELPEIADDPRFYPFVFEHVQAALGDRFAERLKETLYANHHVPSREELLQSRTNTLAVVARVVAREADLAPVGPRCSAAHLSPARLLAQCRGARGCAAWRGRPP